MEVTDLGTYHLLVKNCAGSDSIAVIFAVLDVKFDPNGQLPKSFALQDNFPNPFNPTTTILFAVPRLSRVEIAIYNVVGQEVRRLVDKTCSAGRYSVTWDGSNAVGGTAASGVYFYRMIAGDFIKTKKMLLLK